MRSLRFIGLTQTRRAIARPFVYVETTQPFPHARRIPNDFNDPMQFLLTRSVGFRDKIGSRRSKLIAKFIPFHRIARVAQASLVAAASPFSHTGEYV